MDSSSVSMYEEIDNGKHLSALADYHRHLFDTEILRNEKTEVYVDLCCIDFFFDRDCFIQRAQYWLTRLHFELRTR